MQLNGHTVVSHGSIPIERSDRFVTLQYSGEQAQIIFGYEGNFTANEPSSTEGTFNRLILKPGHFITKSFAPDGKYTLRCCLEPFGDLSPACFILSYVIYTDRGN